MAERRPTSLDEIEHDPADHGADTPAPDTAAVLGAPTADDERAELGVLLRGWRASPDLRDGTVLTIVLALLGAAGRITVPVVVQQAIDHGIGSEGRAVHMGAIVRLAAIAAVVVVIAAIAGRFAQARLAVRAERALYGLRTDAFDHVHRLSIADHAEERRGVLVARVTSDVETLSEFFSWGGISLLVNLTVMAAVLVAMFVYDWRLALVVLVTCLPLVLVLRWLQRRIVAAYGLVRERVAEMLGQLAEVVSGAAAIRAYGLEDRTTRRVRTAIRSERDAQVRAAGLAAMLFPSGELFSVLAIVSLVLVGVNAGPERGMTAGALVGFVLLSYRFLEPVADFTENLEHVQTALAGWRRVLDLLDQPIEVADPGAAGVELPSGPPALELADVSFAYRPRDLSEAPTYALRDVSFRIEPATSVAIVGATGSGKTTLARLLTRLADPTSGRVLVGGIDLRTVTFASLRRRIVLVTQEPFLFDTTIADNVRFGRRDATDADVAAAFAALGIEDWLRSLPAGIATRVGERGGDLSAGERQLVALVRAAIADPVCLVLDEATSSVDPATEATLARALERLAAGRTTITIAHRLSTAARADRVLVFADGRLVEDGTHAALVAAGGGYARLHASWVAATSS